MRRISINIPSVFAIVCLISLGLSSCKTTRVVTRTTVAHPISAGKLIRNIENNAFDFKHLAIKKISCQFDNGKTQKSFKASIMAEKDKQITVMLSKLNITVGRLWLTPDSVKFINYLEDNYFLDDYSYLSSFLGMELDFETVMAVISNNIFSFSNENSDKDNRGYEVKIDSGLYVLESVKKMKAKKINQRSAGRKPVRKTTKILDDSPVHQSIYVDPESFKLRKIRLDDSINKRNLNIEFSDFVAVDKQLYPEEIFLHVASPESNIQFRIKLSGFSTEKEKDIRFKIPENFTRINTQ